MTGSKELNLWAKNVSYGKRLQRLLSKKGACRLYMAMSLNQMGITFWESIPFSFS